MNATQQRPRGHRSTVRCTSLAASLALLLAACGGGGGGGPAATPAPDSQNLVWGAGNWGDKNWTSATATAGIRTQDK